MYNLKAITSDRINEENNKYKEKFIEISSNLVHNMVDNPDCFKLSCGCPNGRFLYGISYNNNVYIIMKVKETKFSFLKNKTGLLHKLRYGTKSIVRFNLGNYKKLNIGIYELFTPIESKVMTLNDIPVNFVISRIKQDGSISSTQPVYNQTYYIQYTINKNLSFTEESKIVNMLRRNHNTYFSYLPKDLINIIRYYCIINELL